MEVITMKTNKVILFENESLKLEVNLKDETVWLNRRQLSELFGRDIKTIGRHINNALKEEVDSSVVANFATTASDGKTYQVEHYSLDMIISIGYRVKSNQGVVFRKWANQVLKDFMLKGYAYNEQRLEYLEKTVKLIDIASRVNDESKEIIKVINDYSKALNLLDDYDHESIVKPTGHTSDEKITYDDSIEIINQLKENTDSAVFALERDKGLESIINTIYQTFDGHDVYQSIEEKAANFLYLITKNHVFIDGNKRIAATLFVYFLDFYNILHKDNKQVIDNNTLVALTLLIAQSNPVEKEVMIDLIMNLLVK